MVRFKDSESFNKFTDPKTWKSKPFGGSATAHPPSVKKSTPDKPYALEKAVKALRYQKKSVIKH